MIEASRSVLDHLAHLLEGDRRRGVAQLRQLVLELLAVLLRHQPDVEERHHLPELHRSALHRPQRRDDLLGRLQLPAPDRLLGGLLAARMFAARVPNCLTASLAASLPTFAVRRTREVGIFSLSRAMPSS